MRIKNLLVLFRNVAITSIKKGKIIIQKGDTEKKIFFIRKGLVRSYSTNDQSEEITFQLYPEHHTFGNAHAIFFNEPSKFCYQALEHTKVYSMNYASFLEETAKHPSLLKLNRQFIGEKALKNAFQRVESFVFLSPEERYLKYIKDYPNLINRAPDKYIANILGITPVSLSRIRQRIASKKI